MPEFNPFKFNSFPVNGARQSSLVARALQQQIAQPCRDGRMGELAPILTFQSVVDFTVSTRAIVNALYLNLPANGSELVLFDINRNTKIGPLLPRQHRHRAGAASARRATNVQDHGHHEREPATAPKSSSASPRPARPPSRPGAWD